MSHDHLCCILDRVVGLTEPDLGVLAATLDDKMSKTLRHCPFEYGHLQCRCDEAIEVLTALAEEKKAVVHERYVRREMSAHQKMARMTAAMA